MGEQSHCFSSHPISSSNGQYFHIYIKNLTLSYKNRVPKGGGMQLHLEAYRPLLPKPVSHSVYVSFKLNTE